MRAAPCASEIRWQQQTAGERRKKNPTIFFSLVCFALSRSLARTHRICWWCWFAYLDTERAAQLQRFRTPETLARSSTTLRFESHPSGSRGPSVRRRTHNGSKSSNSNNKKSGTQQPLANERRERRTNDERVAAACGGGSSSSRVCAPVWHGKMKGKRECQLCVDGFESGR